MSSQPQPIAGNQYFAKIDNLSGQIPKLNVASGKADSFHVATAFSAGRVAVTGQNQPSVVVGFAPTSFATGGIASVHNLMVSPGLPAATLVTDPNLLHLPSGCIIDRVIVSNNGTAVVGGTSFTVGTKSSLLAGALTNASTTNPVVAMLLATVNSANGGGVVGGDKAITELALGTAGQAYTTNSFAGQAQGAFDNLVCVTVNTTANTAGDLAVEIHYHNA